MACTFTKLDKILNERIAQQLKWAQKNFGWQANYGNRQIMNRSDLDYISIMKMPLKNKVLGGLTRSCKEWTTENTSV